MLWACSALPGPQTMAGIRRCCAAAGRRYRWATPQPVALGQRCSRQLYQGCAAGISYGCPLDSILLEWGFPAARVRPLPGTAQLQGHPVQCPLWSLPGVVDAHFKLAVGGNRRTGFTAVNLADIECGGGIKDACTASATCAPVHRGGRSTIAYSMALSPSHLRPEWMARPNSENL